MQQNQPTNQSTNNSNQSSTQSSPTPTVAQITTPTPAQTAIEGQCQSSQLQLTISPAPGGGAAGSVYYQVLLTNTGIQSCSLYGYPGVSLLNNQGQMVGQPAERQDSTVKTVTLNSGQTAESTLRITQDNFDPGVCQDGVTQVKVYPPGNTEPLISHPTIDHWCPGMSVKAVTLSGTIIN